MMRQRAQAMKTVREALIKSKLTSNAFMEWNRNMNLPPNPEFVKSLSTLLDSLSRIRQSPSFEESLSELLDALSRTGIGHIQPERQAASPPDSAALAAWLASMDAPLQALYASAWNFDPWEVAGLGRDEMRNSQVLAWLLNPMGSHGFGDALLHRFLKHLSLNNFPDSPGHYCRVSTEKCPDSDSRDRVDIEIDAANFYWLIEVKIDAIEQEEQLNRYGKIAQQMAGKRPWAIIYLTPGKRAATTGGKYSDHIFPMSWKEVARLIDKAIPQRNSDANTCYAVQHAAKSFVKHVRNH